MTERTRQVVIVPCSGIGKAFGTVSREAGYEVCEVLRPERTRLVALSKLVQGEPEARALVHDCPAVALDGCKCSCASSLVKQSGGVELRALAVLDVYRRNKTLKPEGLAVLNPAGQQLARAVAEEAAQLVDELAGERQGGPHA